MDVTRNDVERMIDASLGATPAPTLGQVEEFVRKTLDYDFATTLTEPFFIRGNADILHQAGKQLVSVISYPLGGMTHEAKLYQARQALKDGADELDISIDVSAFKSGRYEYVKEELKPFVDMMEGKIMKMIYFASLLTEDEQLRAAEMAIELGIPYLKTNTGFGFVTTTDQVRLIKDYYHDAIKVMTSGGVRTREDAAAMIQAGAERIATSSAFKIVDSFNE
ncbi:deoxyribose-phosphate aldolase [Enterocloster sp. OA13]|uniref:deoxyribose-phosphate aldolase n=1 Tax=Enterocloster sp. OA13 TaxID=2914161 RepID=UPI00046F977D|nr:deoxyribose-phosphate aldolase [Enterocloster sp. OA13]